MKVLLKRTLRRLKRDTTTTFRELKKDFEPVKSVIQFLWVAATLVTSFVGLWAFSQTWAVVWAIVGILVLTLVCRVPAIRALKGRDNDFRTAVTRGFLLVFSTGASVCLFMVAIFGNESSAPSFFAGALGIVALLAARNKVATVRSPKGLLPVLDTIIEPLLLFTAIAGIYALPALLLKLEVENGTITLGMLESLDRFGLQGRMFLDRVHFSAVLAFALAVLFIFLHLLERNWTGRRAAVTRKASHVFRSAMRWTNRMAMAALFIASFSFLAVHQHRSLLDAGLRDFKEQYSEFQNKVDQRIEPAFKRELIANAWGRLDERGKESIREAVRNRKAFQSLEEAYRALSKLGFDDRQTGTTISAMRVPDFSKEPPTRIDGLVQERILPTGLEHVSLSAVRIVNILEFKSKTESIPETLEEVKEMDSAVSTGLIDVVTDNTNHQRLFQWLSIHFPGLDDVLNSVKDAGGDFLIEAMNQARDRVIERNLDSPKSVLDVLVTEEARAAAARVPLRPLQILERAPSILAERSTIHSAEASLRRQATKTIQAALEASTLRMNHMALQMKMLDERYPSLHLSTGGFKDIAGYKLASGSWAMAALRFSSTQEAELESLGGIKPFADADSIERLRRQVATEHYDENLLAELAGREQDELPEMRSILGASEFDRYLKIYDSRVSELRSF